MAISSWMIRNFQNRSLRLSSKGRPPPEDCYKLDITKSDYENAYEIYLALSYRANSENKRLSLLNALVKLLDQSKSTNSSLGFTVEEFLYCISSSLVHQFTQIRAAALRAIRHLMTTPKDIHIFNCLQMPHLVCRSLDIMLKNEEERVQALKLIRKMLVIAPTFISPVMVRCLVSLGEGGAEDGDRMLRSCLAVLCEFGVLNPTMLIVCGGVSAITRNVLECHSPRIAESLCGVLLHLLEWPYTRNIAGVRLECLAAPYCDFTYRLGIMDKNRDARDLRFTCSRLALLSVLRSWAGTIEFCDPSKPSGLKAVVDVLYLNQLEVRKAILDLLYELLGLPQPVWTDEYFVAMAVIDPADFQDSWRLSDGFVAMEGRCVLPTLASRVPNICEIHLSLLLYCFLETGLLDALVEVIISSDTFISVRATVLLGKLLHLMHTHLPADICSTSSALPTLISHATQGNHQANGAVAALQCFHQIMKNRPASCSLFLDSIIQSGSIINTKVFKREISTQESTIPLTGKFSGTLERRRNDSVGSSSTSGAGDLGGDAGNSAHISITTGNSSKLGTVKKASLKKSKIMQLFDNVKEVDRLIKESNVLVNKDGNTWDWDIIVAILKSDMLSKMDDSQSRFVRQLVHYFKPSSNRFSHQDLGHGRHIPPYVLAGVELIDWLLRTQHDVLAGTSTAQSTIKIHKFTFSLTTLRLLTDLFSDINVQLLAITESRSAHDCLFSPQHMASTMCQQYFLFIGRLCRNEHGLMVLRNTDVFNTLLNLVVKTNHVCYIKLIVSALDYSMDDQPRDVLKKALTKSRTGRLYATQFMLVLMRAKVSNFEVWGLPMLIDQVKNSETSVVLAALEILEEACHDRAYLEELVRIWPKLEAAGDAGKLIETRFYSIPRGLNHTKAKIKDEIEFWTNGYNKRYVLLVEADTHASLTLHTKTEDGSYSRRSCSTRATTVPPNILPHLYGQLVQTTQGMANLQKYGDLPRQIEILKLAKCSDEAESLLLKSAMWALGHASTSAEGVEFLNDPVSRVYEKIIHLAKHCEVYSIRATALNVLSLIGSTNTGANVLFKLDWICVRHDRNTIWPVCEPEDWLSKHLSPVRHEIGEMPPYNYAGIDDTLNGLFSNSDGSFYFDETYDSNKLRLDETYDTVGHHGESVTTSDGVKTRSRTLPESTTIRPIKHIRSLSESKTTDGISLMSTTHQISGTHRTRFNSGTDSNTSGVSSCDSTFGRPIMSDLQQTLSPIPSSSNLLDLKKPAEERFRKISLTGVPIRETTISPQDLEGYAKWRSLRGHQRPMFSESAADVLAEIIDDETILRTNKIGISEQQRSLKARSLDRHEPLNIVVSKFKVEDFQSSNSASGSIKLFSNSDAKGPCYSGICLPKNILDLFPKRNTSTTYVSCYVEEMDNTEAGNLTSIKQQFLTDIPGEGDESSISSLSDISTNSKRSKWAGKHNRANCLHCCRSKINRLHPRTDSDINIYRRKSHHNSLIQLSDISFNSPESVFSEESMPDRVTANILRYVQRMANPVWIKQSKVALLDMKQKHPHSFQDICLYSEICKAMGRNTYRQNARRFLQELFLDLDFDSFYNEAIEIINRKDRERENNTDFDPVRHSLKLEFEILETTRLGQLLQQDDVDAGNITEQQQTGTSNRIGDGDVEGSGIGSSSHYITSTISSDQIRTTTSVSSNSISTSSINFQPKQTKYNLKSPPLASVYETSFENLSEYPSKSTKILEMVNAAFRTDDYYDLMGDRLQSDLSTLTSDRINTNSKNNSISNTNNNNNRSIWAMRPRFNTLELDLSCTKNKFPITDRNKKKDFSPTTISSGIFAEGFKGLSASTLPPTGSLYCEKRLHSSKSEATLSGSKRQQ